MQYVYCYKSAFNLHTVGLFTESDDTRGFNNTICPPEDEQGTARNMLRIIMQYIYIYIVVSPLSTGILYGRLQRVTIPEAVIVQFVLLKMSKVLLETC